MFFEKKISIKNINVIMLVISAIYFVFVGYYGTFNKYFVINDDGFMYYFFSYQNSLDNDLIEKANHIKRGVYSALSDAGAREFIVERIKLQIDIKNNYALASALSHIPHGLFSIFQDPSQRTDLLRDISNNIIYGLYFSFAFAVIVMLAMVLALRDMKMATAIVLSLAGLALLKLLPLGGTGSYNIVDPTAVSGDVWHFFRGLFLLILKPDAHMDVYGYYPRANFMFLAILVFAYRWRNRYAASYFFLVGLSLVHQGMAWFLLATLIATDCFLRPDILKRAWFLVVLGLIALRASIFSLEWTSVFWRDFSQSSLMALIAAIPVIIVAYVLLMRWRPILKIREKIRAYGPAGSDLWVLSFIWFLSLCLSIAMVVQVGQEYWKFWGGVSGRLLGELRPAFALAVSLALISACNKKWPHAERLSRGAVSVPIIILFVLMLPAIPLLTTSPTTETVFNKTHERIRDIDTKLAEGFSIPFTRDQDDILHFSMIKSMETGYDYTVAPLRALNVKPD